MGNIIRQFHSGMKAQEICIRELLYADNSTLMARNPEHMQLMVDCFSFVADMLGLKTNISKTELLYLPHQRSLKCQK